MKSRVNLLTEELRPKVALYTLNFAVFIWGITLLLIVCIWLWLAQRTSALNSEYSKLSAQNSALQTQLSQYTEQLARRKEDPQLLAQLAYLKQDIQGKKYVLDGLGELGKLNSQNFPALMEDLAAIHQGDLWLTHINVDSDKVHLEGGVTEPGVLPEWLEKLGQAGFFAGQDFGQAHIYRQQDNELHFIIASDLALQADEAP